MTQRMHPYSPGRRNPAPPMSDLVTEAKRLSEESEAYKTASKYERSNMNIKRKRGGSSK